jgi:hypothetical protein
MKARDLSKVMQFLLGMEKNMAPTKIVSFLAGHDSLSVEFSDGGGITCPLAFIVAEKAEVVQ